MAACVFNERIWSPVIDKITYSSEGMLLDNAGYDTNHPSPHAISINVDDAYSNIITASLTEDFITNWIEYKFNNEIQPMRLRPHPYEFALYYDV